MGSGTPVTYSAQRVGEWRLRTQEEFWELEPPKRGKGKGAVLSPAVGQSQCVHIYAHKAVEIPVSVDTQSPVAWLREGGAQAQGICASDVCGCTQLRCPQYTCDLHVDARLGQRLLVLLPCQSRGC